MAKLNVFIRLLFLGAIVSSVALLGSVLAAYIDPQSFIIPAFLGLAFPFIFIGHVILCVLYLVVTRSKKGLFLVVPLLASVHTFAGFFGVNFFSHSSHSTTADTFRFMTYNVHDFKDWDNNGVPVSSDIFRLIEEANPDVICFQDFFSGRKKNDSIDSLKKVLHTSYFYRGPFREDIFPRNALAIFSKFPIVDSGYILLADKESGNQCIYLDLQKGNKTFRVYNVHLQSLKFQPNDFARWERGPAHKISFLSDNVRRLHYAFLSRSAQVQMIKRNMDTCRIPYIVAGDFNDSPSSFAVNEMCRGLNNTFREQAKGYHVTYDGDMPNFQIDYIMAKPSFKVNSYQVISKKLSDHFPVKVDFSM